MKYSTVTMILFGLTCNAALAHGIVSDIAPKKPTAFDITKAQATTNGCLTTVVTELAGAAGSVKPISVGQLAGAKVQAYV
jgi:hypothetical protein